MKKRVVAYARVSSKSRSQAHSLEFQKSYWNEKLATEPDYEYIGKRRHHSGRDFCGWGALAPVAIPAEWK